MRFVSALVLLAAMTSPLAMAHEGPDPLARWHMTSSRMVDGKLNAVLGPHGVLTKHCNAGRDAEGEFINFLGMETGCVVGESFQKVAQFLPRREFTIEAVVSIQKPVQYGGIVGTLQDNGDVENGWLLGYNKSSFTIALATVGADDGDGKITYLAGKTNYVPGQFYHVVAVYDGELLELYVNGKLDASTTEQTGDIFYPLQAPFVIGGYKDDNEDYPFKGSLREISIYNMAARAKWVEHAFDHVRSAVELPPVSVDESLAFIVDPYLQFGTTTGMTVMWQTTKPGIGTLHYGETAECNLMVESPPEASAMHEIRIEGLEPDTQYFYRTLTTTDDGNESLGSDVMTFQTAVEPGGPFAFAVMCDTQGNPTVSGILANYAWDQRPHFVLHGGDLVGSGKVNEHWTDHFFPGMRPLISRVPFYSVLGNHEEDAGQYYKYVSVPAPEYYYTFHYGDAQFFMIDSNKNVDAESEQYKWLEEQLAASSAIWKFVCHHHPPFSSDENDYGELWKTNQGTFGDARVRELVPLYEKYNVDIVWSGHIHSYERTWPIREGKAVQKDGPIYMITGGAGGGLETAGPKRPYFQNNVRHGHHYAMVYINHGKLEFKAFDLEGKLFDVLMIEKP
ncbi:MAG: metallophosphoesterase [Planctomycetota bacterium]|nr:metallophosphoesterase [Planctomycetota bacterium]MDA1214809.1 metallophosphoesterase [Planctomycetota bacterium]